MNDSIEEQNIMKKTIEQAVAEHVAWVESGGAAGCRFVLRGANLAGADFEGTNLQDANLKKTGVDVEEKKGDTPKFLRDIYLSRKRKTYVDANVVLNRL